MKIKAFYSFDIYSPYVQIYNKRKRRNPTGIGLIFSILIFIISILVIIYFILKWKNNTNMTINYSKYTLKEITEYEFNKLNIILQSETFNDTSFIEFSYTYFNDYNYTEIKSNDCSDIDINYFNYFKCLNFSNNLTLQAPYTNSSRPERISRKYLKMLMYECPFYYDYCENPANIYDKYYGLKINIDVIFNIPEIDHDNRINPISLSQTKETLEFNFDSTTTYTINFNYLKYESDNGYFFGNKKTYYSLDFSNIDRIENKRDFLDPIGIIYFKLIKLNGEKYVRNYKKIQDLISEIGGIISILNIIFNTIVNCLILSYSNYEIFEEVIKPFVHKASQHQSLINNNMKFDESIERFNKVCNSFQKKHFSFINKSNLLQKINKKDFNLNSTFTIYNYSERMNYSQIIKNKIFCNKEKNYIFNRSDYIVRKFLSADTIIENLIKTEFYFENQLNLKGVDLFIGTFFEKKEDKSKFIIKSPYKSTQNNGKINIENQFHTEIQNIQEKT